MTDESFDVDQYLEIGIDLFQQRVRERYESREDAQKVWAFADRVAELVHQDVALLAVKKAPLWPEIRRLLGEQGLDEDTDFALQARLAWHLRPSFRDVANRCWQLSELVRRTEPPLVVKDFLNSVARCFLLDLVPECLVMCRAALQTAAEKRLSAERVKPPTNQKGQESFPVKLEEAERRGWLAPGAARELKSYVWHRGSKAAHSHPSADGALEAIRLTMGASRGVRQ